ADAKWLQEVESTVLKNLSNTGFTVEELAGHLNLSRRQLTRRLKNLTGLTPAAYVKEARLFKARQLLENHKYRTIREVSYAVGFSTVTYFSQQFQERFGKLPSGYLERLS
ncbi:MAG: helix-turn-helix domain-containing protein, partial [Saprospiraceae bacterium]|nr:helix-turn-helix domain-containing protein [Saprospiraceae bacterium]